MNTICWTLIPSFDVYFRNKDDCGCLNKNGHLDEHINIIRDKGKIVQWESATDCHDCDPEDCECFDYHYLTKDEAINLLTSNYDGAIPEEVLAELDKI